MKELKERIKGYDPEIKPMDLEKLAELSKGNVYEALVAVSKRANQLAVELKEELLRKIEEFAVEDDHIEEITENAEQIEISRFYEKLPNPALIALYEYLENKLKWEYRSRQNPQLGMSLNEGAGSKS